MSKEQEIKVVPVKPAKHTAQAENKQPTYVPWLIVLVGIYFALVLLVSLLPMSGYMQVLSLMLGTFIICDLHHSIKYHVKNR